MSATHATGTADRSRSEREQASQNESRLVLVVEPDPVLRNHMARAFARLHGIEVVTAGSLHESRLVISSHGPRLVVAELTLPDGSAVALLSELSELPVVALSESADAYRDSLATLPHVRMLSKPVALAELSALVQALAGPPAGDAAPLPFTAADYLQMACAGRYAIVLTLSRDAQWLGQIVLREGEIWAAQDVQGTGVQALQRLLFAAGAEVTVEALGERAPERNIQGPWQAVLLETALAHDESLRTQTTPPPNARSAQAEGASPPSRERRARSPGRQSSSQPPERAARGGTLVSLPSALAAPARAGSRRAAAVARKSRPEHASIADSAFEALLERAVEALLRRRLEEACEAFQQAAALRPDDSQVKANLERLRRMGFGAPACKSESPT